jgi:hypothetical protein
LARNDVSERAFDVARPESGLKRGFMLLRSLVLGVLSSFATTGFQSPDEPAEVDQIVGRHVDALGGIDRLRAIQSLRMSGRVTAGGGREALVARELRRPDRIRTEFTYQGVTGVYAFDGERGWKVSPFDGSFAPELMESEEERQTADQADIEGPLADYRAKGNRVALLGKESLDGLDVYELEVTLRSGRRLRQYLDANTYLPVRAESTRMVRGHLVTVESRFEDYRAVEGVQFAHTIETGAVGRPQRLKVVVEGIEVNPTLEDARFERPAVVR